MKKHLSGLLSLIGACAMLTLAFGGTVHAEKPVAELGSGTAPSGSAHDSRRVVPRTPASGSSSPGEGCTPIEDIASKGLAFSRSIIKEPVCGPELDPGAASSGILLLVAGALLLIERYRRLRYL